MSISDNWSIVIEEVHIFAHNLILKVRCMEYYFKRTLSDANFAEALQKVSEELEKEGFGILTEIDMKATLKKKLDVEFYEYKILGACNPHFAYQALQAEDKIGTMLPCNVIVQEKEPGKVEISAVDPVASMSAINNESLGEIAMQVRNKLKKVIESI